MVKRLSAIFVLSAALISAAAAAQSDEKKLLDLVPAGSEGVVSVNMTEWFDVPAVKKGVAESREIAALTEKIGLSPRDLGALACWWKENDWALLTAWRKPFDPARCFTAPEFVCGKVTVKGVLLYNVNSVKLPVPDKKGRRKKSSGLSFWCTVLPGNVVGFFSDSAAALRAVSMMKKSRGFVFPMQATGSLRGIARGGRLPVDSAFLSCRMTGEKRSDFSGVLSVGLNSAEEAANFRAQGMLMCNLMLIQSMQSDPELAEALVRCLRFDSSGKRVSLTVSIPAPLLKRLGEFANAQAEKRKFSRDKVSRKKSATKKSAASDK